ncbi:MAG TPA: hypothetical protein VNS63_27380 [Blastocatellia bacterium]|nr:hypothetical protein [Blastocatellia bacterium]
MSQRMMMGALVVLIAASGMAPTKPSPEMSALAGRYMLLQQQPTGDRRLTLVLGPDGSATLTIETPGDKSASTTETGTWTVENGEVKVMAAATSRRAKRQVTLSVKDDSLVLNKDDSSLEGGEPLIFRRR